MKITDSVIYEYFDSGRKVTKKLHMLVTEISEKFTETSVTLDLRQRYLRYFFKLFGRQNSNQISNFDKLKMGH